MKHAFPFLLGALLLLATHEFILAANLSTEVVATEATTILTQSNYRFYGNENALTPTFTFAPENSSATVPAFHGMTLRLRINVLDTGVDLSSGATFKLQYAQSTSGTWTDIGTSTTWTFFNNPGVADGQLIVTNVLSNSDVGATYNESNPTAGTPSTILATQRGEWDWVLKNNLASSSGNWFFRMVRASGTALNAYNRYPALILINPADVASSTFATSGGTFAFPLADGNTCDFTIPSNFYTEELRFRTFAYPSSTFISDKPPPSGQEFVGSVFDFNWYTTSTESVVTSLSSGIAVTCSYKDSDIGTNDETTLKPYRRGVTDTSWTLISGSTINTASNTVTFSTASFSSFALLGSPAGGSGSSDGKNPSVVISGGAPSIEEAPATKPVEPSKILDAADLNRDRRIDIADLSILLYHYQKRGLAVQAYDLNGDLTIDLIDISILIYYWTE